MAVWAHKVARGACFFVFGRGNPSPTTVVGATNGRPHVRTYIPLCVILSEENRVAVGAVELLRVERSRRRSSKQKREARVPKRDLAWNYNSFPKGVLHFFELVRPRNRKYFLGQPFRPLSLATFDSIPLHRGGCCCATLNG